LRGTGGEEEERETLVLLEKPQSLCLFPASEVLVCIVEHRWQVWDYSMDLL